MRRITLVTYVLLAVAALLACVAVSTAQELSKESQARIDKVIEQLIDTGHAAGIAIAIAHEGQTLFAKGYGFANLETGTRVETDTVFRIGSVTKQFTAAAIMILAEQGKLSVRDKLDKFIPSFPRGNEVTIYQLLTHTSGIHDYLNAEYFRTGRSVDMTTAEFVDIIQRHTPLYDFDPGTHWSYSNSGYYLLGAIIEQVSGMSFHDFLQKAIFDKAGMKESAVDDASEIVRNRASGYDAVASHPGSFRNAATVSLTTVGGAGAVRSSAEDLVKWQNAFWNGTLLRQSSLQEMISPARLRNGALAREAIFIPPGPSHDFSGQDYGYGLRMKPLDGFARIGHGGDIFGFGAQVDTFPQQHFTIILLSNTSSGLTADIERTALHVSLDALAIK